ncbi:hypothetical protein CXG81DRAFT_24919 [Caulochytrium protostelioides]|uniref:Uncharacterized protein n=1 Tax=Caulochytrium protostelioides TaxID=1555241 RepID=A0A4P9XAR2_9FUNG|nr:hypothetical protein CXG81DRAFT_24919 [Caulochytrium protostelioides]|eukprot:RKP02458.1 hypothetical protein CXG81DRAFT_24919 [Caulochytrium protostelioides]
MRTAVALFALVSQLLLVSADRSDAGAQGDARLGLTLPDLIDLIASAEPATTATMTRRAGKLTEEEIARSWLLAPHPTATATADEDDFGKEVLTFGPDDDLIDRLLSAMPLLVPTPTPTPTPKGKGKDAKTKTKGGKKTATITAAPATATATTIRTAADFGIAAAPVETEAITTTTADVASAASATVETAPASASAWSASASGIAYASASGVTHASASASGYMASASAQTTGTWQIVWDDIPEQATLTPTSWPVATFAP